MITVLPMNHARERCRSPCTHRCGAAAKRIAAFFADSCYRPPMSMQETITFNLDHVLEILRKGIRRADVFMGIGLNAATHDPPVSHILAPEGPHHIRLVKEELTDEERAHVAAEFGKWVRTNGIRELIETFSIFLHRLYMPMFVMRQGRGLEGEKLPAPDRFERMGIADQVDAFAMTVPVSDADRRMLASLNQARNCFAHRQGRVGERDIDAETAAFCVRWSAFQLEIAEPDGNIVVEDAMFGRVFENGGMVQLRVVEREKAFALDDELILEKRELKEICFAVLTIGQRFLQGAISAATEAGVLQQVVDQNLDDPKPV